MQLTSRDVEIMRFINDMGFCIMPQIAARFSMKVTPGYRLIRRLISAGYVRHRPSFHSQHGAYYLSAQGAKFTDLPAIDKVHLGCYEHQLTLTDVYLRLMQQHPDTSWISERTLKHDKFYEGVGKAGHVSDGILVFPDGKQVAIEVELSIKGKNRIERIFKSYVSQFSIREVWYYCPEGMILPLKTLAEKIPFIKINSLSEFLS